MKWSDMSPRERDALVAEKVMGWKWLRDIDDEYYVFATDDNQYNNRVVGHDFCPSETISAAWEVVEKMDEWIVQRARDGDYWVTVRFGESWYLSGWVKRAPEAICKAVLKAVGVDVE
jgi:hypothetical protein